MTQEDFWVHCGKCGYERALCSLPAPVDVIAAVSKLPCASCGSKDMRINKKPKPTAEGDPYAWVSNGDTGVSSMTIWSVMMGRKPRYADLPHDPADFGRCYRLLKVMPSWRSRLGEVAAAYQAWKPLVDAWDELTTLYETELPRGTAPKLYDRMQQLIDEAQHVRARRAVGKNAPGKAESISLSDIPIPVKGER